MDEGDNCPSCGGGTMRFVLDGSCTCHLGHPPCSACVNSYLECNQCSMSEEEIRQLGVRTVKGIDYVEFTVTIVKPRYDKLTNVGTF